MQEQTVREVFKDLLKDLEETTKKTWAYMEPEEGEQLKADLKAKIDGYKDRFEFSLRYAVSTAMIARFGPSWVQQQEMVESLNLKAFDQLRITCSPEEYRDAVQAAKALAYSGTYTLEDAAEVIAEQMGATYGKNSR